MVTTKIQLRKIRNFSDSLNDVLQFLRQEFKPLMRGFFLICGLFILAGAILNGLYSSNIASIITGAATNDTYIRSSPILGLYGFTYFLSIFFSLLTQMVIYAYVASYLKIYESKNNESPNLDEIWAVFRSNILYLLLYGLLLGILVVIGFVFCLAPGFYLYTVFAPFGFIIVMEEDKNLGNIFGRCFFLIKENFWPSLGLYLLMGFIYSSCAGIIGFGIAGITGIISYFTTKNVSFVGAVVGGILQVFSSAFSILLYLTIGMQYFSLEEKSNGTGLLTRIQNMGNEMNDTDNQADLFIKD